MACQLYQLAEVRDTFAARIDAKEAQNRAGVRRRAEKDLPFGGLFARLFGMAFDVEKSVNTLKGERGEALVLQALLHALPDQWTVFHNVVIEPQPGVFAQIDLLVIGSSGLFLIETKAWRGSYIVAHDRWQRRAGQRWMAIDSPTAQVQRQARLLRDWLAQHRLLILPQPIDGWVCPFVIFTHAQWLRVSACSVAVFADVHELVRELLAQPADVLTTRQSDQLCDLIIRTPTPVAPLGATEPPLCPACNVPMVLRTARQGPHRGQSFYGCQNYPRCKMTRNLP